MLRPRKRYFSVIASDFGMGNRFDQAMFDHCIEVLISPTNPIKDILSEKEINSLKILVGILPQIGHCNSKRSTRREI
jgi:hypothetical protein